MTRQAAPITPISLLTASSELGRGGFGRPARLFADCLPVRASRT
jgi:hypothetical protein